MNLIHMHSIGIYSGTFDPPHRGHEAFALAALLQCGLSEVVLMPEPMPRGKVQVTDFAHRLAMAQLLARDHEHVSVYAPQSAQFTIRETLPELQARYPGAHLTFLIGSDVAHSLHRWEGIQRLVHEASFAIGVRHTDDTEALARAMHTLASTHEMPVRHTYIHTTHNTASSYQVRQNIHTTRDLPPKVNEYLLAAGLYR